MTDQTPLPTSAPTFRVSDVSAAQVLRAIRFRGPVSRSEVADVTGLSKATVARAVTTLQDLGAVRPQPGRMSQGATGRPGAMLELDPAGPVAIAVHIGLKNSVVAVCDLSCRVLAAREIPTESSPGDAVDTLSAEAFRLLDGFRGRRLAAGGVATAARVTGGGRVDHDLLGWAGTPLGELFTETIGVPFSVAPHVEAMAAAELLVGHERHSGTTLLVYGREYIGSALAIDGVVHQPSAGPADLRYLPFGKVPHLDDRGEGLIDTVSDHGLVRAARKHGLTAESVSALGELAAGESGESGEARAILRDRALALGRVVGTVSAVLRPDTVVLAGQAFTDHPKYLPDVLAGSREVAVAGRAPALRVSTAGRRIQEQAAMAVALDRLCADPEAVLSVGARPGGEESRQKSSPKSGFAA